MIKVLFFGPVVERVGHGEIQVEFQAGVTLKNLHDKLAARYPRAFEIVCLTAVDGEHVKDMSLVLDDNSEVTFMAKFSGG